MQTDASSCFRGNQRDLLLKMLQKSRACAASSVFIGSLIPTLPLFLIVVKNPLPLSALCRDAICKPIAGNSLIVFRNSSGLFPKNTSSLGKLPLSLVEGASLESLLRNRCRSSRHLQRTVLNILDLAVATSSFLAWTAYSWGLPVLGVNS